MDVCQLRLYNSFNILVDSVDFMAEPFGAPLNLRIPKATKRQRDTGENLFRDGSDISSVRYNNAVITLQPRFAFGCSGVEGAKAIESLRSRMDGILEAARNHSIQGYGMHVYFYEDTKGFILVSEILDGTFDIEEDWDWSNVGQGAVVNASMSLVRRPFRHPPTSEKLENYVVNPGFEVVNSGNTRPAEWTVTGTGASIGQSAQAIEGKYGCSFAVTSPNTSSFSSTAITLANGSLYYVEAWVNISSGATNLVMSIIRTTGSVLVASVTWHSTDIPIDVTDTRVYRERGFNKWDIVSAGEHAGKPSFIRKGFIFTAPAADTYTIKFSATTPATTTYTLDRVYLTDYVNLPVAGLPSGKVCDPTIRQADANLMPKGWISDRAILNHHDSGATDHGDGNTEYHINWVEVSDIAGDVPAYTDIKCVNNTGNALASIFAALRSYGSVYDDVLSNLGIIGGLGIGSGSADTAASGGDKSASGATLTTTYQQLAFETLTTAGFPPTRASLTGNFHVIIRIKDTAASQGNLRARYQFALTTNSSNVFGSDSTPPSAGAANWSLTDLGVIGIPDLTISGITSFSSPFVASNVKRTTGASIVEQDYFYLLPADEWYATASPTWSTDRVVHFSSFENQPSMYVTTSAAYDGTPSQAAPPPYLRVNANNRLYFLYSRTNGVNVLNDQILVSVTYQERYL